MVSYQNRYLEDIKSTETCKIEFDISNLYHIGTIESFLNCFLFFLYD